MNQATLYYDLSTPEKKEASIGLARLLLEKGIYFDRVPLKHDPFPTPLEMQRLGESIEEHSDRVSSESEKNKLPFAVVGEGHGRVFENYEGPILCRKPLAALARKEKNVSVTF